jgi:hypothetical protein
MNGVFFPIDKLALFADVPVGKFLFLGSSGLLVVIGAVFLTLSVATGGIWLARRRQHRSPRSSSRTSLVYLGCAICSAAGVPLLYGLLRPLSSARISDDAGSVALAWVLGAALGVLGLTLIFRGRRLSRPTDAEGVLKDSPDEQ